MKIVIFNFEPRRTKKSIKQIQELTECFLFIPMKTCCSFILLASKELLYNRFTPNIYSQQSNEIIYTLSHWHAPYLFLKYFYLRTRTWIVSKAIRPVCVCVFFLLLLSSSSWFTLVMVYKSPKLLHCAK